MKEIPLWVAIETVASDHLSMANILLLAPPQRWSITNPITKHNLTIWDRFKTYFGLQSSHNPLLAFLHNPSFYPAWTELSSFSTWTNTGLIRAHHLFALQIIIHFLTLRETFNLPPAEIFRYLQLKHFFSQNLPPTQTTLNFTSFERACNTDPHRRGLISDWSQIWQTTKSASLSTVALERYYRVLTRWYLVRDLQIPPQLLPQLLLRLWYTRDPRTYLVGMP